MPVALTLVTAPVVGLAVQSALLEAGVRAVLAGAGLTVLGSQTAPPADVLPDVLPDVLIVDDAALEDPAALSEFAAVVTLGSVAWAGVLPDLELSGWAALPADATPAELLAGVLSAAAGLAALPSQGVAALQHLDNDSSDEATAASSDDPPEDSGITLTPRESDVLELLSLGLSNKRAARELGITESTVKFHLQTIYSKLGVQNRAAAVSRGLQLGLVRI